MLLLLLLLLLVLGQFQYLAGAAAAAATRHLQERCANTGLPLLLRELPMRGNGCVLRVLLGGGHIMRALCVLYRELDNDDGDIVGATPLHGGADEDLGGDAQGPGAVGAVAVTALHAQARQVHSVLCTGTTQQKGCD